MLGCACTAHASTACSTSGTGNLNRTLTSLPCRRTRQGATDSYVNAELYRAFWGLQAAFQNPHHTLEPSRWAAAVAALNRVLDAFARLPIAFGRSGGTVSVELGITVWPALP